MAYHHIDEMQSKCTSAGVEELVLLSPSETNSKRLKVRLLTTRRGMQTESKEYLGDIMYYVINGKALLTIKQLKGDWKYPLNNDTAIWIPPMSQHTIKNTGEGLLRCMEFSTAISKDEDISDIFEQHLVKVVERLNCPKQYFTDYSQHTLFSPTPEARKLYFGAYHTLPPGGFLPRHVENLDCEETMYVTRGIGKITSGDSEHKVSPGSLVYVPSRTWHSIENACDGYMEVLLYESRP